MLDCFDDGIEKRAVTHHLASKEIKTMVAKLLKRKLPNSSMLVSLENNRKPYSESLGWIGQCRYDV